MSKSSTKLSKDPKNVQLVSSSKSLKLSDKNLLSKKSCKPKYFENFMLEKFRAK
jgi:hypothetical protein